MSIFTPVDQATRHEIEHTLHVNLCVEAGAGTGKTTVLVARIINILRSGFATVDQIAVITFTEKAAAELAARVREGLERARVSSEDPDEQARLSEAIRDLNRARIETIHAFANGLLRERPVEAGLDPGFDVLDDLGASLSFDEAFQSWLGEILQERTEPIWRALNRGFDITHLRDAAKLLHEHRSMLPLTFTSPSPVDAGAVLDELTESVEELERLLALCRDGDDGGAREIHRIIEAFERYGLDRGNHDALERTMLRPVKFGAKGNLKNWDREAHLRQKELCGEINGRLGELRDDLRTDALLGVLPLAQAFVHDYAEQRRKAGKADFDDLLIWARDLLRDNLDVRAYFQRRFRCLLVDEFQDTDPLQVEIVLYLSSDGQTGSDWRALRPAPGKLFVVGDPKQSIYRFRRADITIYDWVKREVLADGHRTIVQNFRSLGRVIGWVNDIFAQVIEPADGIQPEYVKLEAVPSDVLLPHPTVVVVTGDGSASNADDVRKQEAESLAAMIRAAIRDECWSVRDPETKEIRPACWRDVAVLLPRRTGIDFYEEAFADAGVPYRHEGGRAFFDRQEVRELMNCLKAIDDPTDRLSLVAALRSGAFGCSDSEIFQFVESGGELDLRVEPSAGPPAVGEAIGMLATLSALRGQLPLPELLGRVLRETHLVEYALTLPQGEQAAANLLKVVDQARAYSAARGRGLRAFVRWLATSSSTRSDESDAAVAEASDDVVRLLTIYAAKGLEFPIVAMANLNGDFQSARGSLAIPDIAERQLHLKIGPKENAYTTPGFDDALDREARHEAAENRRLLYVAATRARDYLIVPAVPPPDKTKGILAVLQPLLPAPAGLISGVDSQQIRVCEASSLAGPTADNDDQPGQSAGEPEINAAGARQTAWQERRAALIERAARGSRLALLDSAFELEDDADTGDVDTSEWREPGRGFGTESRDARLDAALHIAWGRIDLPDGTTLNQAAKSAAESAGVPEQTDDLAALLRNCLSSPVIGRALANRPQRMVPFAVGLPDGGTAEGRFDLLFVEAGELIAVDVQGCPMPSEVDMQARAAMLALVASKATGLPVREVVFILAKETGERSVPVDDALLALGERRLSG